MEKDLLKNNPAIGMSWEEFEKEYFNTGGFDSSCSGGTFSDHKSG